MFCKKCGSELDEGDAFCSKCGAKINEEFVREEYDPLVALDKGEIIEDNVIWQEAPLDEDTIIIDKPKDNTQPADPEPEKIEIDDSLQVVEKQETKFKDNVSQGIRAAKATIANPIKPRKRIKPATPKTSITPEEVIIPETTENTTPQVTEPEIEETPIIEKEELIQEIPQPTPTEETTTEIPVTDSIISNDDVVDIFDDFVVDDSFGIVDETPTMEESTPEPVTQETTPEEALFDQTLTPEPKSKIPTLNIEEVEMPPIEASTVPEPQTEVPEPQTEVPKPTKPEPQVEAPKPTVPEPVVQESQIEVPEPVVQESQIEVPEPVVPEPQVEVPTPTPRKTMPTPKPTEQIDLEELINEDNDTPILNSIQKTENKVIKKKEVKKINDVDEQLQAKFNTKLEDEIDEDFDVDENINSLTSRITTVLIIILILVIAIVIATFLVQNIGL